jgi:probable HAF family extracellular repeat protein
VAILATAALAANSTANASAFSFTQIDVPGAAGTFALGINSAGEIVGAFNDAANHTHGFLDTGGSFTKFDVPGITSNTEAFGINDLGQIVGQFNDVMGVHGFLDTGGSFTQIDAPRHNW